MLRTCIGLALGAALAVGLCLARRPATAADGTTGSQVSLQVQLEKGLRAMRPQEFAFLAIVEQQVDDGELPSDLVNTAFLVGASQTPVPRAVLREGPSTTDQPCRGDLRHGRCVELQPGFQPRHEVRFLRFIDDPPVPLRPRDAVGRVQPGQHELDARGPHGGVARGVDFERLVPGRRHALQPLGVGSKGACRRPRSSRPG